MSEALELARKSYRELSLYAPERPRCTIDLGDNTNRFGTPPAAAAAQAALAGYAGVGAEEIATGCGSDDVLDSALRAFTEPGDAIAYPDPTFAMVPIFARMNGLTPIAVPLRADYDLDAEALLAANARVIYLCLPNNPTGTAASRAAIERVIDAAPGLVIVDEAYAEYAGEGLIESAPRRERLLVTRTLSKAFGLAGLRVGYAAGNAGLIAEVEKSRGPFKVGAAAERAAIAAVTADRGWMRAAVERLRETRARFAEGLRERGFAPLPSAANFVLVPVDDAARRAAELARRDVAVRPFRALSGIGDALRITIGPWETMERVLAALDEAGR